MRSRSEWLLAVYEWLKSPAGSASPIAVRHWLEADTQLRVVDALVGQKPVTEVERPNRAGRLGLGTVQFGQAYGISNRRGQVPLEEARVILSRADRAGMGLIDTAANYGDAEQVLSQSDKGKLRIVTKTMGAAQGVDAVVARVRQSAKNLGRVDLLLVHGASDLAGDNGRLLWNALQALKVNGEIGGLGISAYVADDPVRLAEQFRPDAMQLPFSLLDQRLLQDGSLRRLKALGVEIHARSLFLQGLLFMDTPPKKLSYAAPMLAQLKAQIERGGSTPLSAALAFVLARPEVDVAVVGVNAARQLDEILAAISMPSPELDWAACALDDTRILTPSLW